MTTPNLCTVCQHTHTVGSCPEMFLANRPKKLTWQTKTPWQKALTIFGLGCALIMSVACGVSTAAAFLSLGFLSAGIGSYLLTGIIFVAGALMNWYIFKGAAPNILIDVLGKGGFLKGLFEINGDALDSGCQIVKVNLPPTVANMSDILVSNSAYIRYGNELYYLNKERNECVQIKNMRQTAMAAFDLEMGMDKAVAGVPRRLSEKGIDRVSVLTNHSILTRGTKAGMYTGILFAVAVGATFGALYYTSTFSLTAAFGFLAAISPAFPPIAAVLAGVSLVCLTALMLKDIIKLVRTENFFAKCANYLWSMVDVSPRCEIREMTTVPTQNNLKELGANSAIVTVGDDVYYINKDEGEYLKYDISAATLRNKLARNRTEAIEDGDRLNFKDMKDLAELTKHKTKSRIHIFAERLLTTFLSIAFIPLAVLGLYMTMNACAPGLKDFFMTYIPNASAAAVEVCSNIIALGFAFLGQIPFTLQISVEAIENFIARLFSNKTEQEANSQGPGLIKVAQDPNQPLGERLWKGFVKGSLYTLAIANAVGNGLISVVGATMSFVVRILSGVGGTWNSFAAGASSIEASLADKSKNLEDRPPIDFKQFSSKAILASLNTQQPATANNRPGPGGDGSAAAPRRASLADLFHQQGDFYRANGVNQMAAVNSVESQVRQLPSVRVA